MDVSTVYLSVAPEHEGEKTYVSVLTAIGETDGKINLTAVTLSAGMIAGIDEAISDKLDELDKDYTLISVDGDDVEELSVITHFNEKYGTISLSARTLDESMVKGLSTHFQTVSTYIDNKITALNVNEINLSNDEDGYLCIITSFSETNGIVELKGKILDESLVSGLTGDLQSISNAITSAEESAQTAFNEIQYLSSEIKSLSGTVDGLSTIVDSILLSVDGISSAVGSVSSYLTGVVNTVSTDVLLSASVSCSGLDGKITSLSTGLSDYVRNETISTILSGYQYQEDEEPAVPLSDINFDTITFGQMASMLKFIYEKLGGY